MQDQSAQCKHDLRPDLKETEVQLFNLNETRLAAWTGNPFNHHFYRNNAKNEADLRRLGRLWSMQIYRHESGVWQLHAELLGLDALNSCSTHHSIWSHGCFTISRCRSIRASCLKLCNFCSLLCYNWLCNVQKLLIAAMVELPLSHCDRTLWEYTSLFKKIKEKEKNCGYQ